MLRPLSAALFMLLAASCASIGAFNRSTPHDQGAVLALQDAAYAEGERGRLDVYAPASGAQNAPVLVFFYGGGWRTGAKKEYSFVGDAFAAHGFVTVIPDYRLAPDTQFPGFIEDNARALRWVQDNIARYGGDPERIVLVGHSAGAYNAVMVALDQSYAREAGFDTARIQGVAGLAGPYAFTFSNSIIRTAFGEPNPARMHALRHARADAPALLLLTGDADARVPVRATTEMRDAALAAGGRAEVRIYEGMTHAGILQALALERRDQPVFHDVLTFARAVTNEPNAHAAATTSDGSAPALQQ